MSTTKYRLAEQVMVALAGGDPGVAGSVVIQDAIEAIGQACNRQLKAEYWQGIQFDGLNAGTLVLATYENIPVVSKGKVAVAKLPAYPMKLPKGMGVFEISKTDDYLGEDQYAPIPAGSYTLIRGFNDPKSILDECWYIWENMDIIFTRNIVDLDEVTKVRMKLVIADVVNLSEHDVLPLPPELESAVIQDAMAMLGSRAPRDTVSDNVAEPLTNK